MDQYFIKIRICPPRRIKHGSVEQILPDLDNPTYETMFCVGDFEDVCRFALNRKKYHNQFIGTRAEIVSIAEV